LVGRAPAKPSRRIALSAERRLIYADSSALVKLIIDEPETRALELHLAESPSVLVTSRLACVEVSRATALANPSQEVQQEVDRLMSSCTLVDITTQLLSSARKLTSASVRTLDAIHLASALRVEADALLAYDQRLLDAANEHLLAIVSPR
jgi:predicted nucleic acid-binding protein